MTSAVAWPLNKFVRNSHPAVITSGPFAGLRRKHYRVILADPAWSFATRSEKGDGRSARKHYDVMSLADIAALPVAELMADDCVLFLWVTDTHLEMAFKVISAWGFKYKTVGFYWEKTNADGTPFTGMGYWTRANPEQQLLCTSGDQNQCLLATSGAPKRVHKDVPRLIRSPRREHSRKPDEIYERIERLVDGPYVELFSRNDRAGWHAWGNDAGKFNIEKLADRLASPPRYVLAITSLVGAP